MAQTAPPPLDRPPGSGAGIGTSTSGRGRPPSADRPTPALATSGGRQRRWTLALLALLLTVGSGLAFVVLWLNAGDRRPVLAAATSIAAGQQIQREHLAVVRVSTDPGLTPIPASQRDEIVGQVATVDILPGTLLVDDAVGRDSGLAPNAAVIAVALPPERLPAPDLETGDTVLVLRTTSDLSEETGVDSQEITQANVLAVQAHDTTVSVSLNVDRSQVSGIAAAAQAEQIYLAEVPNR
jgi:hypothetical protein